MKQTNQYVIVRSRYAGAFAGKLVSKTGDEVILDQCRRLWYWAGAASLSQLAIDGTKLPKECKFPPATNGHTILGVIEIIPGTEAAQTSIDGVVPWRA